MHQNKFKYFIYFIYTIQIDRILFFPKEKMSCMLRYIKCAFPDQTAHFVRYYQRQIYLYTWKLYIGADCREFEHRAWGQLETLFVSPAVNGYPFFDSAEDKAPKENELCVPYLVPTITWPSNLQCSYRDTP